MRAEEMVIRSGAVRLAGTLTGPEEGAPGGSRPLVICVHGSGPLDRNSNTRHQKLDIFNALAEHLAVRGIACFRYDKRGTGQSGGNYHCAGHLDFVRDALAVARHFRADPAVSRLFLLGHSEGTLIVPQVARECPVDGLLLLCPFLTELEDLLERQGLVMQHYLDRAPGIGGWIGRRLSALRGGVVQANRKLIARVRRTSRPVLWQGLRRVEARWIRELLEISPRRVFETVRVDSLVLVAGRDVQCPPEDGEEVARIIGARASHVPIAGLSHMLRLEGRQSGLADYGEQLKRPVAPEVLETVAGWLAPRAGG